MHPSVYLELFEDEMGLDTMGLTHLYPTLVKLIQKRTIPIFSEMFPCRYPYVLDPSDNTKKVADIYGGGAVEYILEDSVLKSYNMKIISFGQIHPAYKKEPYSPTYNNMYIGGNMASLSFDDIMIGAVAEATNSIMRQQIAMSPILKLKGNNVLSIKNMPDFHPYIIELYVTYPNINSISLTFKRYFMNLAKYDVGIYLYNKLKYMEDVVTPAGNLNLKIADWEGYSKDKEDYIKELLQISFPDRVMDLYFNPI